MDAILLCGGKGTRLAPVVSDLPKPMAPVAGRPFLDYLLSWLEASRLVERAILATGHLAQRISEHYGSRFGRLALAYSEEAIPLGTGGAVLQAIVRHRPSPEFLVLNADSFVDFDLAALCRMLGATDCALAMAVHPVEDAARFGTVNLEGSRVTGFREKLGAHVPGLINAGIYAARPASFAAWSGRPGVLSLEQDVLPALVAQDSVRGLIGGSRFIDIGLPETYAAAAAFFGT